MFNYETSGKQVKFTFCFDSAMDADIIQLIAGTTKGKRSRVARIAFRSLLDQMKAKPVRAEGIRIIKKEDQHD